MSDQPIYTTQDPKYVIQNNRLVNAASLKPIPADEPIFLFRAQDALASERLGQYHEACRLTGAELTHRQAVQARIKDFDRFAKEHPDRMKYPDTDPGAAANTVAPYNPLHEMPAIFRALAQQAQTADDPAFRKLLVKKVLEFQELFREIATWDCMQEM